MCEQCASGSTCNQCQKDAVLLPDRTCELCSKKIEGCEVCENFDKCKKCSNGFTLSNNRCTEQGNSAAIIIVCVAAGLVAVGGVGTSTFI